MRKTAQNYGEEWSLNYELRRLGMHGNGGVGNSKARRQVWERQMFREGGGELQRRSE